MSFSIRWAGILVASSGDTSRASRGMLAGSCLDLCIVGEELLVLFVAVAVFELVSTATLLLMVFVVCVGGKGE